MRIKNVANQPGMANLTGLVDPQSLHSVDVAVIPTGTSTFNSTQIGVSKTASLIEVIVASSVPWKAELQTVENGVVSENKAVWFSHQLPVLDLYVGQITQVYDAAAGLDAFRVVVTNLDPAKTADIYCTFFWDEE